MGGPGLRNVGGVSDLELENGDGGDTESARVRAGEMRREMQLRSEIPGFSDIITQGLMFSFS